METAAAWAYAVQSQDTPTALVLTRQNLPQMAGSSKDALKGAYIIADSSKAEPDEFIIAAVQKFRLRWNTKGSSCKGRN